MLAVVCVVTAAAAVRVHYRKKISWIMIIIEQGCVRTASVGIWEKAISRSSKMVTSEALGGCELACCDHRYNTAGAGKAQNQAFLPLDRAHPIKDYSRVAVIETSYNLISQPPHQPYRWLRTVFPGDGRSTRAMRCSFIGPQR